MPSDSSVRSAQRLIEGVAAHGVRYIFGVPGAKVDEPYDALADGGPELIVCRHEQNATFMAAAIGRLTGVPGVVLVTSGPGTANLPAGLVTANTEQDPVVALCGAVPLQDRLKRTHQSMNAAALLSTVTKYTAEITDAAAVPEAVANAFRIAATQPRGAVALVLADDVMAAPTDASIASAATPTPLGPAPASEIDKAAAVIRSAARPVLMVGLRGADVEACQAVRALLRATALPIVETFQAAGVVSRELESCYAGRVGLFKNQPGDMVLAHADVLVTIGYDPVEYDPRRWNADPARTVIHIDSLPAMIDNNYQPALELRGDLAATVRELAGQLGDIDLTAEFAAEIAAKRQALDDIDQQAAAGEHGPAGLNPAWLVLKMREHLNDDATITVDMVLMRDNAYDMVAFQQVMKFGRKSGVQLGDYDVVGYAEAFGAHGYRVRTQQEFLAALDKGLREDGPSIIDVPVDYSHSIDIGAQLHLGVLE